MTSGIERPLREVARVRDAPAPRVSKTSMKVRPMIRRFSSGIGRRPRGATGRGRTRRPTGPRCRDAANASSTCWRSCARRRPWSTRIGWTRSPSASRSRSAVTEESTPPESAQMTAPDGACRRIASTFSRRKDSIVQSGSTPQTRKRKFSQDLRAVLGVADLGMELDRRRGAAPGPRRPRSGVAGVEPMTRKPGGGVDDRVAVAHPDGLLGLEAGEELRVVATRRAIARPYSPRPFAGRPLRRPRAPSTASRSRGRAPARRSARGSAAGSGAPSSYTLCGPPDRMIPAGFQLPDLLRGRVGRAERPRRPAPRGCGGRSAACTGRRSRGRRSSARCALMPRSIRISDRGRRREQAARGRARRARAAKGRQRDEDRADERPGRVRAREPVPREDDRPRPSTR